MSMGSGGDPRERRVVKNELAFRAYNERRTAFEATVTDEPMPVVCECGDEACFSAVDIFPREWEAAHARDDQFVVIPGHIYPDLERVVSRSDQYWIVQKLEPPSEVLS
jgi:hypothetical protein